MKKRSTEEIEHEIPEIKFSRERLVLSVRGKYLARILQSHSDGVLQSEIQKANCPLKKVNEAFLNPVAGSAPAVGKQPKARVSDAKSPLIVAKKTPRKRAAE